MLLFQLFCLLKVKIDTFFLYNLNVFALFNIKRGNYLFYRTYVYGNRRYGYYQPNGYGNQYPGQYQPEQFPGNTGLGDDRFKFDPVST